MILISLIFLSLFVSIKSYDPLTELHDDLSKCQKDLLRIQNKQNELIQFMQEKGTYSKDEQLLLNDFKSGIEKIQKKCDNAQQRLDNAQLNALKDLSKIKSFPDPKRDHDVKQINYFKLRHGTSSDSDIVNAMKNVEIKERIFNRALNEYQSANNIKRMNLRKDLLRKRDEMDDANQLLDILIIGRKKESLPYQLRKREINPFRRQQQEIQDLKSNIDNMEKRLLYKKTDITYKELHEFQDLKDELKLKQRLLDLKIFNFQRNF